MIARARFSKIKDVISIFTILNLSALSIYLTKHVISIFTILNLSALSIYLTKRDFIYFWSKVELDIIEQIFVEGKHVPRVIIL